MVVIEGPRRSGRTTKLLEMANEAKGCFVAATYNQKEFWKTVAKRMELKDVEIVSVEDIKESRFRDGAGEIFKRPLFINDLDYIIYSFFGFDIAGVVVKSRDDIEVIEMTTYREMLDDVKEMETLNDVKEMETLDGPGIITKATADRLKEFNTARNWDEIHTAPNLAKSISIEAAELLELFQWDEKSYDVERVKEELADVIIYSLIMVEALNLDADAIVNEKITKNSKKYPTCIQG